MKKRVGIAVLAAVIITLAVVALINIEWAASGSPPESLPLPEKASSELQALGIKLPEQYDLTPSPTGYDRGYENSGVPPKTRFTTHDKIAKESAIWDVEVTVWLLNIPSNQIHYAVTLQNKTDEAINVQSIELNLNPQLEYHYFTYETFMIATPPPEIGSYLVHPVGSEGENLIFTLKIGMQCYIPEDNPISLPAETLKEKFAIFLRDFHIITEWDGGREVLKVNPEDIIFRKNITDGIDEQENTEEDTESDSEQEE